MLRVRGEVGTARVCEREALEKAAGAEAAVASLRDANASLGRDLAMSQDLLRASDEKRGELERELEDSKASLERTAAELSTAQESVSSLEEASKVLQEKLDALQSRAGSSGACDDAAASGDKAEDEQRPPPESDGSSSAASGSPCDSRRQPHEVLRDPSGPVQAPLLQQCAVQRPGAEQQYALPQGASCFAAGPAHVYAAPCHSAVFADPTVSGFYGAPDGAFQFRTQSGAMSMGHFDAPFSFTTCPPARSDAPAGVHPASLLPNSASMTVAMPDTRSSSTPGSARSDRSAAPFAVSLAPDREGALQGCGLGVSTGDATGPSSTHRRTASADVQAAWMAPPGSELGRGSGADAPLWGRSSFKGASGEVAGGGVSDVSPDVRLESQAARFRDAQPTQLLPLPPETSQWTCPEPLGSQMPNEAPTSGDLGGGDSGSGEAHCAQWSMAGYAADSGFVSQTGAIGQWAGTEAGDGLGAYTSGPELRPSFEDVLRSLERVNASLGE